MKTKRRKTTNMLLPRSHSRRPLLGNFEENILNSRLEPVSEVEGYSAEVRASGHFQPRPLNSLVRVSFFSAGDCFPYLGQIQIGHRGYRIPKKGTLQVTLFNPLGSVEKLFLLLYDLNDMPPNSQTILRQRTILVSSGGNEPQSEPPNRSPATREAPSHQALADDSPRDESQTRPVLYLIHLNIISSKSGRIYLNKDLRIFVSKKIDLETASQLKEHNYELRSFDEMPKNPRYFTR